MTNAQLNDSDVVYPEYSDSEYDFSNHLSYNVIDIYKLAVISSLFIIGIPMNICVMISVITQLRNAITRLLLLQLHLCIAGLLVLLFFALPQICWISTLEFRGGNGLCKLLKFGSLFSLYLSSNIVACMSIDRAVTVVRPLSSTMSSTKSVKWLIGASWTSAIVCSLPQLYFWRTFTANIGQINFTYCTNVHKISEIEHVRDTASQLWFGYTCFHLIMVFWIPFLAVLISYAFILRALAQRHRFMVRRPSRAMMEVTISYSAVGNESERSNGLERPRSACVLSQFRSLDHSTELLAMPSLQPSIQANHTRRLSTRARKMTALIVLFYVACWLPYNLVDIWALIDQASDALHITSLLYDLIILNSVVNPFIYYNKAVLKAVGYLKKCFCK